MARIVKVEADMVSIGMPDGSLVTVPRSEIPFSVKEGMAVEAYRDETGHVLVTRGSSKRVSKIIYILLAVFLGNFGIHRFYAGHTVAGICYLVATGIGALLAFIGIVLIMIAKLPKRKEIGNAFVGFAVLMFGMTLMSGSVAPLADSPVFTQMLTAFRNPLLGVLVGLVVTAVIQSSAASVGMLQALSMTGGITYGIAIPIIMGQNIGTCATAILSSIGVSRNAKRVAAIHLSFNLIGTAVFMIIYYVIHSLLEASFLDLPVSPVEIAICHSVFNISTTILLLLR